VQASCTPPPDSQLNITDSPFLILVLSAFNFTQAPSFDSSGLVSVGLVSGGLVVCFVNTISWVVNNQLQLTFLLVFACSSSKVLQTSNVALTLALLYVFNVFSMLVLVWAGNLLQRLDIAYSLIPESGIVISWIIVLSIFIRANVFWNLLRLPLPTTFIVKLSELIGLLFSYFRLICFVISNVN